MSLGSLNIEYLKLFDDICKVVTSIIQITDTVVKNFPILNTFILIIIYIIILDFN